MAARLPPSIGSTRLSVEPLDHDEVRVLMSLLLEGADVSDEFAAYLHEHTAGIPFAVEEVLRLLEDRQDLVRWHGRWARRRLEELEVPEAVRDAVLHAEPFPPNVLVEEPAFAAAMVPTFEHYWAAARPLPWPEPPPENLERSRPRDHSGSTRP